MRNCIRLSAPDVIGTQEGYHQQLIELAADLPDYDWIGQGREGGNSGEFAAVFFRRERFEPQAVEHFWLSDTPEIVGSSTWGNTYRRMVTWVRFRERRGDGEFFLWNTHLDDDSETSRQKAASLILDRVNGLQTDLPILLTGDFNAVAGNSRPYEILVNERAFADTWSLAGTRINARLDTFHDFVGPSEGGERIDWILARGAMVVDRTEIVAYSENGQYPSDHCPVVAWLRVDLRHGEGAAGGS